MAVRRWTPLSLALAIAAALLLALALSQARGHAQSLGTPGQPAALTKALRYLALTQGPDGSYGGLGFTADVVLAVAAAERDPAAFGAAGKPSVLQALEARTRAATRLNAGALGKLSLAAVAADADPRAFAGLNLPLSITQQLSPTGAYDLEPFDHALAMLGLAAAGEPLPISATTFLLGQQLPGGAWDDGSGSGPQPDATALAIQALLAAGLAPTDTTILSATAFLNSSQNADAGWPLSPGQPSNANSTAFVIQALAALGEDYSALTGTWAVSNTTPISALLALQTEGGGFRYQADPGNVGPDPFSTWQAIPALAGRALPIVGRAEAARRALAWLKTRQLADGGFDQFGGGGPFSSPAAGSARAIRAIRGAGQDPQSAAWNGISGTNVVSAMLLSTPEYLSGTLRAGRPGTVALGVVAAGPPYTVTDFAGFNLVLSITNAISTNGSLDSSAFSHALGMLALQEAGFFSGTTAISATDWLSNSAVITGSADTAGIVLQALAGADIPRETAVVTRAIDYLLASQLPDGGWGFAGSNPNSTGEAIRGLLAYGVDPRLIQVATDGQLASPTRYLVEAQASDGSLPGFFGPDEFATTDALFAWTARFPNTEFPLSLAERRFPVVLRSNGS
jgi:hypothetical protein